jgi:hypothetical protein
MTGIHNHDAETKRLIAQRRKALTDHRLDADEFAKAERQNGEVVVKDTVRTDANTFSETEVSLSKMLGSAPSTTGDIDILRVEAELLAEGNPPGNPHVPINAEVREQAREVIEANGDTPAWEVGD